MGFLLGRKGTIGLADGIPEGMPGASAGVLVS
jgi:hypothetical protein